MNIAVLQFPGSGSDQDTLDAFRYGLNLSARLLWHKETDLGGADFVVLPGGFSFGDYLRPGAIASHSPVIRALKDHVRRGGSVLGIGNGFQILCEAGLLPGGFAENRGLQFRCETAVFDVEDSTDSFNRSDLGETVFLPIACARGNYRIDDAGMERMEKNNQVLLRFGGTSAEKAEAERTFGSQGNIAGIRNEKGNVFGMMPHPERAMEKFHPSRDGEKILGAVLELANSR